MLTRFSAWNDDWTDLFSGLQAFRRDIDRAFSTLDHDLAQEGPRATLSDAGETFVVSAFVPGLDEKALALSLNEDVLTVQGERQVEPPKGYTAHRRERGAYKFSRSFAFPAKVDPEKVTATLDNGVLTVTVAKSAQTKPRSIAIKTA
jgi:HSP20 family protein